MNDEIKEILDKLKSNNYPFGIATIDINKLLDYITNLQQENERLKENNQDMQIEMAKCWQGIDKAIEYIKSYKNDYAPYELSDYNIRELLNILQGENNE